MLDDEVDLNSTIGIKALVDDPQGFVSNVKFELYWDGNNNAKYDDGETLVISETDASVPYTIEFNPINIGIDEYIDNIPNGISGNSRDLVLRTVVYSQNSRDVRFIETSIEFIDNVIPNFEISDIIVTDNDNDPDNTIFSHDTNNRRIVTLDLDNALLAGDVEEYTISWINALGDSTVYTAPGNADFDMVLNSIDYIGTNYIGLIAEDYSDNISSYKRVTLEVQETPEVFCTLDLQLNDDSAIPNQTVYNETTVPSFIKIIYNLPFGIDQLVSASFFVDKKEYVNGQWLSVAGEERVAVNNYGATNPDFNNTNTIAASDIPFEGADFGGWLTIDPTLYNTVNNSGNDNKYRFFVEMTFDDGEVVQSSLTSLKVPQFDYQAPSGIVEIEDSNIPIMYNVVKDIITSNFSYDLAYVNYEILDSSSSWISLGGDVLPGTNNDFISEITTANPGDGVTGDFSYRVKLTDLRGHESWSAPISITVDNSLETGIEISSIGGLATVALPGRVVVPLSGSEITLSASTPNTVTLDSAVEAKIAR